MDKYIVSKSEIKAFSGISKTHFLNSKARRVNKSLGDLTGLTGFGFHIIEIQPSFESTEKHAHYYEDECIYILDGQAEAHIGNDIFSVSAGDFIGYKAGGKSHKLVNNGETTLRCIVVGQRLDHDVADYTDLNKRIYRQKGMLWNLVDISSIDEIQGGKKA